MSELEKARAGVFLSLLALTLSWLLLKSGDDGRTAAQRVQPIAVCAATHGAICEPVGSTSAATAHEKDIAFIGEVVVTASRAPAPLGRLVVSATRLPDPFDKVRLAEAVIEHKSSVVQ